MALRSNLPRRTLWLCSILLALPSSLKPYAEATLILNPLLEQDSSPSYLNLLSDALLDLTESLELWNLSGMGDRVHKMSTSMENYHSIALHPKFLWEQFIQTQFPWWLLAPDYFSHWIGKTIPQADRASKGIVVPIRTSSDVRDAGRLIRILRKLHNSPISIELALPHRTQGKIASHLKPLLSDPSVHILDLNLHYTPTFLDSLPSEASLASLALLASSFEEIILLSPDTILLTPPEYLFEQQYDAEADLVFFHDRALPRKGSYSRCDWIANIIAAGSHNPSAALQSSSFWEDDLWQQANEGLVYANKRALPTVLSIAFSVWMNTPEIWEGVVGGHIEAKKTLWLAAELSNVPYHFASSAYASLIGASSEHRTEGQKGFQNHVCGQQTIHFDARGEPVWMGGGLDISHAVTRQARLTHVVFQKEDTGAIPWEDQGNGFWCSGDKGTLLHNVGLDLVIERIKDLMEGMDDLHHR
ncbi:hypothetical protein MMC25_001793 [Agyrium rufum]|nr:hypothetical protein [Agyrium rufum]